LFNASKLQQRLLSKVVQSYSNIPNIGTPCLLWQGTVDARGRPKVWYQDNSHSALKVSYIAFVGNLPLDSVVTNICYNHTCINPLHLAPTTRHAAHFLRGRCPQAFQIDNRWLLIDTLNCKADEEIKAYLTQLPKSDVKALRQAFNQNIQAS